MIRLPLLPRQSTSSGPEKFDLLSNFKRHTNTSTAPQMSSPPPSNTNIQLPGPTYPAPPPDALIPSLLARLQLADPPEVVAHGLALQAGFDHHMLVQLIAYIQELQHNARTQQASIAALVAAVDAQTARMERRLAEAEETHTARLDRLRDDVLLGYQFLGIATQEAVAPPAEPQDEDMEMVERVLAHVRDSPNRDELRYAILTRLVMDFQQDGLYESPRDFQQDESQESPRESQQDESQESPRESQQDESQGQESPSET
ncbi:hypothetical protein EDC01DRAFT_776935 [Geopyxis carbonaria]|nr:hypothetical protein EDC01DRAFT_776935 [Geopyxis carbonaria]